MKKIINLFINHKILTNWLVLLIFIAGTFGLVNLNKRIWPAIEFDWISTNISWPGASAREVEEGLIMKVEDQLMSLEGIIQVQATAYDGGAYFGMETDAKTDKSKLKESIDSLFQSMPDYPEDARQPYTRLETQWNRVMLLFIYGEEDQDPSLLEEVAEEFKEELLNTGEVSEINFWGFPREEIVIEMRPEARERYGFTLEELASLIRAQNLNASSGSIHTKDEQIELRQYQKKTDLAALQNIPVSSTDNGRILYFSDICTLERKRSENAIYTRANGRNAIGISIMYSNTEDVVSIGKICDSMIEEYEKRYQGLLHFDPYIRDVDELDQRLGTLTTSGLMGLVLVVIVLGLFLNLRLSFWVAMGIPISFFGLLFLEWILGITINEMSLFGMIMVIGILVDDGIVIGENIFRHHQELGKPMKLAALEGTLEVMAPVAVSIATTVIAFAPYFFLYGDMGKYTSEIGTVVIISLIFSLVEAMILLPAHLAHINRDPRKRPGRFRVAMERFQQRLIQRWYRPLLEKSLKNRGMVLALLAVSVLITAGAFLGNHIKMEFFPELESSYVYMEAAFPAGTSADTKDRIRNDLEKKSMEFGKNYEDAIDDYLSWSNENSIVIYLLLKPAGERDFTVKEFGRALSRSMPQYSELESLIVGEDSFFGGDPLSVSFLGKNQEQLEKASELFKAELSQIRGVKDIRDNLPLGKREYVFELNEIGRALGLNEWQLNQQIQSGFSGVEVMSIQEGAREIPALIRYPQESRDSLQELENMTIRTPSGDWVPLKEIVHFSLQRSLQRIQHQQGYRSLVVSAGLDTALNDVSVVNKKIQEEILPRILAQTEGVSLSKSGQAQAMDKMIKSMIFSMVTALLFMFTLLMFQMRSYGQSIVVLTLIPLGIIGAVLGHGLVGIPLSFISFLGCIALGGIIVNDSVVMIDQYNRLLSQGMMPKRAALDAAVLRFRPILMTTLTTSIGLAPLIYQKSEGGQLLIPIAVSISFGLLFGTFLTLMLLPALLSLMSEMKLHRKWKHYQKQLNQREPRGRENLFTEEDKLEALVKY